MKFVKKSNQMKSTGNNVWWDTSDIISHIARNGTSLNQGLNIFEAEKIVKACTKSKEEKKGYIDLEDSQHNLLLEDIKSANYQKMGLSGAAIAEDIRSVMDAPSEKPKDYEDDFVPVFPK